MTATKPEIIHASPPVSSEAYWGVGTGGDPRTSGEISVLQSLGPKPFIIDGGAHYGEYLRFALEVCPDAKVWCFEPSSRARARFNGGRPSTSLVPYGLSDMYGTGLLYSPSEELRWGLASLTRRRLDHFGIAMSDEEYVSLTTLDHYCKAHPDITHVDLFKLDIEGHELAALKGAQRMFAGDLIGLVQFEFGGCNIDSRTFLQDFYYFFKELNWRIARILPTGQWLEIEPYREIYEQFRTTNYVAYPEDKWNK